MGQSTLFVLLLHSKLLTFFLISSLKWYKDDVEFYSYIPRMKEGSKKRFFDLPGVFIDVSFLYFKVNSVQEACAKCFAVHIRDIHIECSKQFKLNSYFYVSGQSRPFWAALKLL